MKTFRTLAAAAAALLLLGACTHEMKTGSVSDERFVPLKEGSEIGLTADYNMEYISGGLPKDVMDRINGTLIRRDLLYDVSCDGYQADAGSLLEDMEVDLDDAGWMLNWSYSVSGRFAERCKARGWQSYCCSSTDYTGGAHGMFGETWRVFDLATGEEVEQGDLLADDYDEEALSDLLYEKVLEGLDEEESADGLFGTPEPNENFSVSDEGVTWHYNPYEIAPYAFGVLEATLTWEELKPFLK